MSLLDSRGLPTRVLVILLILPTHICVAETVTDSTESVWEASFGTTQLFSKWYSRTKSEGPTASATLVLSRRLPKDFALWWVLNLPLSSKKNDDPDSIENTINTPTFMFGASYEPFSYTFGKDKNIGFDIGLSVGRELLLDGRFFPVAATRLKVNKGDDISLYLGATSAPYNTSFDLIWGLVYGVGTRF